MLSRKLKKQLKQFDLVGHPECSHNWIHNAGKQCEWDMKNLLGTVYGDSNNIAYMYICTMCGGEYWSSDKSEDIEYYRVRERRNING